MVYVSSFQALPNISVPSSTELGSNSPRTPVVPPVCYVNKSVLAESLPAILASGGNAIVIQHHLGLKVLSKFLARVPDERTIKSVQELHLPWEYAFSPHLYPGTLDLPFACQGLRTLSLQVEAMLCFHKVYEANGVVVHAFKSAQEVTSFFKLRQVFELPMLRSLTIRCCGGDHMAKQVGCKPEDIFANLVSVASAEADKKSADFELMFKFNEWSGQAWGFCRWS
ncbi:hypothetical protein HBH70_193050 [Parastagonospora nodorum]|nr:hypothetical protein HBI10_208470 [Parastagonospora nodorum]KAH4010803.1 hypothetical protein HBI13_202970 [Parastagonospora nodorum]KAH4062202.1 hypothetical protein HBH50_210910 [Parastagonospora nodorum]KAH4080292.1 hypothetical protein HBH48_208700 [Parastagonospora nodorum]KAH4404667.1 hypothetical protein HBH92_191640 [Parastagonospora nodorum]